MYVAQLLAGAGLVAIGAVSFRIGQPGLPLLPLLNRLDRDMKDWLDAHLGDGAFVGMHRLLSALLVLFGIAFLVRGR